MFSAIAHIAGMTEPVFQFLRVVWAAIPGVLRLVMLLFFAFCIGFTMIRNFLS